MTFFKQKKNKNTDAPRRFSMVTIVLLLVYLLLGTVIFLHSIRSGVEENEYKTLSMVSAESAKVFQESLQGKVDYLNNVWMEMQEAKTRGVPYEDTIQLKQSRSAIYGFDWIGFVDTTGVDINSRGLDVDLSDEVQNHGKLKDPITIERRTADSDNGQISDVIVLSVLVYDDDNNPAGLVYEVFSMSKFRDLLSGDAFSGNFEASFIEPDGTTLAVTSGIMLPRNSNVLSRIRDHNPSNLPFIQQMEADMKNNRQGSGTYTFKGNKRFCAYAPVSLHSKDDTVTYWFSGVLPPSIVTRRVKNIMLCTLLLTAVIVTFIVAFYILFYFRNRDAQRELKRLAFEDPLTGEKNFAAFRRDFERLENKSGILIACDLNGFKLINKYLGVESGNRVLTALAKHLSGLCSGDILCARAADDNFLFFYPGLTLKDAPERCMELNIQVLSCLQSLRITEISAALGCCETDGTDPLDRSRDKAMFAKSIAKRSDQIYCIYDEEAAAKVAQNVALLNSFERALTEGQFEIWYQPKYLISEDRIGGAEALIRWRGNDGNMISPGRFLPVLEEHNKVAPLDSYVFTNVCKFQKSRMDQGLPLVPISVNVSRRSLNDPELPTRYKRILTEIGVDQNLVRLEITEESAQGAVLDAIRALRKEGFLILMDDFGCGHSNLANLRIDLFDEIKFDKSLIDLIGSGKQEMVVSSALQMVKKLGMKIVAEGVEYKEQADYLRQMACDEIQGFFFYRPMDESSFAELLKDNDPARV